MEGGAPLPPLILDEPTANLDSEHVDQIANVVDTVRQLGIDQTLVVSHNKDLCRRLMNKSGLRRRTHRIGRLQIREVGSARIVISASLPNRVCENALGIVVVRDFRKRPPCSVEVSVLESVSAVSAIEADFFVVVLFV